MFKRIKVWNRWRKGNLNDYGKIHKFLVLLGLRSSESFLGLLEAEALHEAIKRGIRDHIKIAHIPSDDVEKIDFEELLEGLKDLSKTAMMASTSFDEMSKAVAMYEWPKDYIIHDALKIRNVVENLSHDDFEALTTRVNPATADEIKAAIALAKEVSNERTILE